MKTTLFALALAFSSVAFVGCSGNKSDDHAAGTHAHDDGSVHADHAKADTTKQEEFTATDVPVGADSTATAKPHTHANGDGDGEKHDHDHKHE